MNELELLRRFYDKGLLHVVGRTTYRSARINGFVFKGNRDNVKFLENKLSTGENHCVMIVQLHYEAKDFFGADLLYFFLTDSDFLVGKEIVFGDL